MADIDFGSLSEALNDKVDRDLDNFPVSSYQKLFDVLVKAFAPDYAIGDSISFPFTAPSNGWVSGVLTAAHSENYYVRVNGYDVQRIYGETNQRVTAPFMIFVKKGDVVSTTGGTNTQKFYPCIGITE